MLTPLKRLVSLRVTILDSGFVPVMPSIAEGLRGMDTLNLEELTLSFTRLVNDIFPVSNCLSDVYHHLVPVLNAKVSGACVEGGELGRFKRWSLRFMLIGEPQSWMGSGLRIPPSYFGMEFPGLLLEGEKVHFRVTTESGTVLYSHSLGDFSGLI